LLVSWEYAPVKGDWWTSFGMERICVKYRKKACALLFSLDESLVKTPSRPPKAESIGTESSTCGLSSPGSRTDSCSSPCSAFAIGLRFYSEARDRRSMVDNEGIAHRPLVDQRFDRLSAGVQRFKVAIVPNTPPKGLDEPQNHIGWKCLYALPQCLRRCFSD